MAVATLPAFTPDGAVGAAFGAVSSNILLPGTDVTGDSLVIVTNLGTVPVFVALGSSTVAATVAAGSPVQPGQQRVYARGSATYLAGIVQGASTYNTGINGILSIETGN